MASECQMFFAVLPLASKKDLFWPVKQALFLK